MQETQNSHGRSRLTSLQFGQLCLALHRSTINALSLLHQGKPAEQPSVTLDHFLSGSSLLRLLIVYARNDQGPLVLVAYFSTGATNGFITPAPRAPWESYSLAPDWTHGVQKDCFVQISPFQRVLRGSFAQARADVGPGNTLSVHLGGASLWLNEGLENGSVADGVDTVGFTSDYFEVWG